MSVVKNVNVHISQHTLEHKGTTYIVSNSFIYLLD